MFCARCGVPKPANSRFCDSCGQLLNSTGPFTRAKGDIGTGEGLLGFTLDDIYRLDEIISRGATAVVYRGTNVRLDQPVAVKVLQLSYAIEDPLLMSRFEAEARVQARLRHPNIVSVQDYLSFDNLYAIVMEYFEGVTLDQVLYDLDAPMELSQIREMIYPVLDAVAYAHEQGVVHRDIKPSNVLMAEVGERTYPKVMDFGIAKVLAETNVSQTAPGAMLGTLLYMSPEQCKALKTVDERSDVYSLGITLYQMATGMVPFYAESAFDIMIAHVQTPPPPPRSLVSTVPVEFEAAILKALAKDPAERFASVPELRAALEAVPDAPIAATSGGIEVVRNLPGDTIETMSRYGGTVAPGRPQLAFDASGSAPRLSGSDTEVLAESELLDQQEGRALAAAARAHDASSGAPAERSAGEYSMQREGARAPIASRSPSGSTPAVAASAAPLEPGGVVGPAVAPAGAEPPRRGVGWNESAMRRIRLRVPAREDWDRYFDANIFGGGIFCPTSDPPQVGTPVRVEITFVGGPRFLVGGVVTWRRPKLNDPRARAGVGVQVHPGERNKISYVNDWVRGGVTDQRRHRRLPVKLRATYSARSGRRINFTRDINEEGVFLRSLELLDLNTPIRLLLLVPGHPKPVDLKGRVTRLVEDRDDRGMGIRLEFRDDAGREAYSAIVQQLEHQFLAGELPDEVVS